MMCCEPSPQHARSHVLGTEHPWAVSHRRRDRAARRHAGLDTKQSGQARFPGTKRGQMEHLGAPWAIGSHTLRRGEVISGNARWGPPRAENTMDTRPECRCRTHGIGWRSHGDQNATLLEALLPSIVLRTSCLFSVFSSIRGE